MPKFGAHQSISGGLEKAILISKEIGFDTVQIFSKNSNQWKASAISDEAAHRFTQTLEETGIVEPLIHDSYLINLASPKPELLEKSIHAFADELCRAEKLQVQQVVMHPGSSTTDSRENGLRRVASSLDSIFASNPGKVQVLLETTAGQGTNLGSSFEELAEIRSLSSFPHRLGICLDTCHIFAAGYDFSTREKYELLIEKFDRILGLENLKAFHLNDSVRDLGSHVDRHEHIGHGKIGRTPFGFIVRDPRFVDLPMYLETPKGEIEVDGKPLEADQFNLTELHRLLDEDDA